MRILWQSVSPLVGSGYGMQTASVVRQLKQAGHDVAIFNFYGLQGAKGDWNDIPIYPSGASYGVEDVGNYYKDWNADLLISLVDVWVLKKTPPELNWVPWMPVDHDPAPPRVLDVLQSCPGIIKPIAMSKFGQEELRKQGIDSYYVPHAIDCRVFSPNAQSRKDARENLNWQDKFVIGTVATNCTRKNWNASFWAVSQLAKKHKNIVWYMHTKPYDSMGFNLQEARLAFGLEDKTFFPNQVELELGIPPEVLARAYNAMDVFLLPSKGEGFGLPAVEAQACGCPIITSNNTAMPELLGGGWLLKEQIPEWTLQDSFQFNCNPHELLDCLEQAYRAWKSGKIEEKKQQARRKALEYDEPKIFSEYWLPTLQDIEKRLKEAKESQVPHTIQLGKTELYQDVYIKGKTVKKGKRECDTRYQALKEVLSRFNRPFTMLDIGAGFGYYSIRAAEDFNVVSVMIEGKESKALLDICRKNELDNTILLSKWVTADDLGRLASCEHFDVVLALNILHHFGKEWESVVKALLDLGDNILVETPPPDDKGACGQQFIRPIADIFWEYPAELMGYPTELLGEFPRHTDKTKNSRIIWVKAGKTRLAVPYWNCPVDLVKPAGVEITSDFDTKTVKSMRSSETRDWRAGINLWTYQALNGQYPEPEEIISKIRNKGIANYGWDDSHGDIRPWNIILAGKQLFLIDAGDKRHSYEPDTLGVSKTINSFTVEETK